MSTIDRAFDRLVPEEQRHLSSTEWTPVDVAIRATTLLCPTPGIRVLDVGAGVGKLCVVGALSAFGVWVGVEQDGSLVQTARKLSRSLGVSGRTMFVHGDAFAIDWREFDAIYLYNPFATSPRVPPGDCWEQLVLVAQVQERLASLPARARVVTFRGFGGAMPSSYELVYQERVPILGMDLVLWVQRAKTWKGAELS